MLEPIVKARLSETRYDWGGKFLISIVVCVYVVRRV